MKYALLLLALGLPPQDGAQAQTSNPPPVSLAPPKASQPRANARRSEPSPPVIGAAPAAPNPAADYDGFSAGTDDSRAPSQLPAPARSRTAKDADFDAIDQEDAALKRKLMICQNCK